MAVEFSHGLPLIPLAAMLLWGRKLPARFWLLMAAFLMSGVGDTLSYALHGSWGPMYAWVPIHIGLALWAFLPNIRHRLIAAWCVLSAMVASIAASAPGPDILLMVGGGFGVVATATLTGKKLVFPVWMLFGFGTVSYVFMVTRMGTEGFMPAWYSYQACRLAAYLTFAAVVWSEARA